MKLAAFLVCSSSALLLAGCATPASTPVPPHLVPAGERFSERFASRGVALYECREKAGEAASAAWVYVAAVADLIDEGGRKIGQHTFPPPLWELSDGSKVSGQITARADSPSPGAVPWLLVVARSTGGEGRLSKVTSLQRVNTAGGAAPSTGCNATSLGGKQKVSFTADYVTYTK